MPCLIVNHFNQKFPEKTVNRMSLIVLDIECIESNIVKELRVYKDGQTVGYSFLPPKKFKQHPKFFGVHSIFMESTRAVVTKNILNLKKIEKSRSHRNGIFCKRF